MGKEKSKEEVFVCPVGRFFADMERVSGRRSTFFKHINQSRIEFFKALRSLVDERIEGLEKQIARREKKVTRVDVE
jgi:hypothetical protein